MDLQALRRKNLELTRHKIKNSVSRDMLIIHAQNMVENINADASHLVKRLKDWYDLYCPEFSRSIKSSILVTPTIAL